MYTGFLFFFAKRCTLGKFDSSRRDQSDETPAGRQHQLVLRHRSLPAKSSTDDVAKSSGSVETNWISHGAIPSFRLIDDVDRALFAAATRVTVRNGSMARLWTMPWVHGNTLAQMFPAFVQAQSTEEQNCGRGNMDPRPNARRYDRYSCRICDALVSDRRS
jgi:hypothetical protein